MAKDKLSKNDIPKTEVVNFLQSDNVKKNQENKHFDQDEYFIKRSEEISNLNKEEINKIIEKKRFNSDCLRQVNPGLGDFVLKLFWGRYLLLYYLNRAIMQGSI